MGYLAASRRRHSAAPMAPPMTMPGPGAPPGARSDGQGRREDLGEGCQHRAAASARGCWQAHLLLLSVTGAQCCQYNKQPDSQTTDSRDRPAGTLSGTVKKRSAAVEDLNISLPIGPLVRPSRTNQMSYKAGRIALHWAIRARIRIPTEDHKATIDDTRKA